jgi:hypothetical protein
VLRGVVSLVEVAVGALGYGRFCGADGMVGCRRSRNSVSVDSVFIGPTGGIAI